MTKVGVIGANETTDELADGSTSGPEEWERAGLGFLILAPAGGCHASGSAPAQQGLMDIGVI